MTSPPQISVIVCTHNRADLLDQVLLSLSEQDAQPSTYEIIVVDNGSTDHTCTVVEAYMGTGNVRYCYEAKIGLSHARNAGWKAASSDYVGFVDDDCIVPASWVSTALEIIDTVKPDIFGGPYFPFYDTEKPKWFKDAYGTSVEYSTIPRPLTDMEFVSGGNFVCRRDSLELMGGFSPDYGMAGQQITYGEETFFQLEARRLNPDINIYYHPGFSVLHLVRQNKMSVRWLLRAHFASARDSYRLFHHGTTDTSQRFLQPIKILRIVIAMGVDALHGLFVRDRTQFPYFQNYLVEQTSRFIRKLGAMQASRDLAAQSQNSTRKIQSL